MPLNGAKWRRRCNFALNGLLGFDMIGKTAGGRWAVGAVGAVGCLVSNEDALGFVCGNIAKESSLVPSPVEHGGGTWRRHCKYLQHPVFWRVLVPKCGSQG